MFKKILIPVDLDENGFSDKAVQTALEIAEPKSANLQLLIVQPGYQMSMVGSFFPKGAFKKLNQELKVKIKRFADELLKDTGLDYETMVIEGKPADVILMTASKVGADIIVMASHKHRGINKLILGSVANKVVGRSTQPVLLVKP